MSMDRAFGKITKKDYEEIKGGKIIFPNEEVQELWPKIYEDIRSKITGKPNASFQKEIREILKKYLGTELIRTDKVYQKFFHDVIRFAVNKDADIMIYNLETKKENPAYTGKRGSSRDVRVSKDLFPNDSLE